MAHATALLSQFNSCPTDVHFKCVKRCIRYLQGTKGLGLKYLKVNSPDNKLITYCDANYADNSESKSFSGVLFLFNGCLINWLSKKQSTVATSTTHAECKAADLALRELIWLRELLSEIGFEQNEPSLIYCDSQPAINLLCKPDFNRRTKHFNVMVQYLKEKIAENIIHFKYITSQEQLADFLTKNLNGQKLREVIKLLKLDY